jgi:chromosome segregation ATPase
MLTRLIFELQKTKAFTREYRGSYLAVDRCRFHEHEAEEPRCDHNHEEVGDKYIRYEDSGTEISDAETVNEEEVEQSRQEHDRFMQDSKQLQQEIEEIRQLRQEYDRSMQELKQRQQKFDRLREERQQEFDQLKEERQQDYDREREEHIQYSKQRQQEIDRLKTDGRTCWISKTVR